VEVRCGSVRASQREVLREAAQLQPYTVTWSNCSDYMGRDEFHQVARGLSNEETVHYGYRRD
jgi:hypothetical protein